MKKKSMKLKWKNIGLGQKLFVIINSILVVGILSFYAGRLFYYKAESVRNANKKLTDSTLSQILITNASLTTTNNGLCGLEDGSYLYKGTVNDNYILYDGYLCRMLGIDTEGNIRIVFEEPLFDFYMSKQASYSTSVFNSFLNEDENQYSGIFKKAILSSSKYLFKSSVCIDTNDNLDSIGCGLKFTASDIVMLSLYDYKEAGAANSFLNNNSDYWLTNTDSNGNYWFVDEEGNLSINKDGAARHGLRPVLTISYSCKATSGSGTLNAPYVITDREYKTISDAKIGQYVSYSGSIWKISLNYETGAIALLDGTLQTTSSYGKTNAFNTKEGVGKYLNTTYLKTLKNYTSYLVYNNWYMGKFTLMNDFDYRNNYQNTYACYVSLPNSAYPFYQEYKDCFVTSQPYESNRIVFTITETGDLYSVLLDQKKLLRPTICFKPDINIVSGTGTQVDPFVLEDIE